MCRTNCGGGGGKEGTGEEGREKNRETRAGVDDKHIAVLLEPSEATFKTSAFCFTDATVCCNLCEIRFQIHFCIVPMYLTLK